MKRFDFLKHILWLFILGLLPIPGRAADWPTFGHDPQRSGWAIDEDTLNTGNVGNLKLLWKARLPNQPLSLTALTAPLIAAGVTTPEGIKNLAFVAGSSDHVFAVDTDSGQVVWSRTFHSGSLPKEPGMWLCPQGINATPVLDRNTNRIYVLSADGKLWGLDLGTGKDSFGPVQFVAPFAKPWSLNLSGGVVYTSMSQGCNLGPSGIYGMDVRDPRRPTIHELLIAHVGGAGIWGRGGPVIGTNGKVYALAGDGNFDPHKGDYGSTLLSALLPRLGAVDYYLPLNYQHITQYDLDMGAGSPVFFSYHNFNLVCGGGKEGVLYLLDADNLGGKDHQTPLQVISRLGNDEDAFEGKGLWGAPSAWHDEHGDVWIYVPVWGPLSRQLPNFPLTHGDTPHGSVLAFKVTSDGPEGKPQLAPAWISTDFDIPEPVAVANGVVFGLSTGENSIQTTGDAVRYTHQRILTDRERQQNTTHAVLYALDARTGATLFNSGAVMGTWVHFSGLAVANGKVFTVDHDSNLYCFGLKK
jgi:outer membrane protein assembly factor BamB